MSQFDQAIGFVLRELDRRRQGGYDDWRATVASVDRLRAVRPRMDAEAAPATRAVESPTPAMPKKSVAPDALPLFAAQTPPPAPPARTKAAAASTATGVYETVTDPSQPKGERMTQLRACPERLPCLKCPYGQGPDNQHVVFGVGSVDAEIVFVGEAPGAEEDVKGEPFVGRAGQLLTKIINTMGYQREDIYLANILKCRPDTPGQAFGNRPPTPAEMHSCRPTLYEQIEIIQPKAIVALGATAMKGLLDLDAPMRDLRGRWHDFRGTPVMATYHPSYLLRNQLPTEKRKVWEDLLLVKERLGHVLTERDRSYFLSKD